MVSVDGSYAHKVPSWKKPHPVTGKDGLWQPPNWSKKQDLGREEQVWLRNQASSRTRQSNIAKSWGVLPFYETIIGKLCYPGSTFQARDPLGWDQKPRRKEKWGMWTRAGTKPACDLEEGQTPWHQGSGEREANWGSHLGLPRKSRPSNPRLGTEAPWDWEQRCAKQGKR